MLRQLRPALVCFASLTFVTGVLYPAFVTAIAKTAFATQADGSLLRRNGRTIGSSLIAQPFTGPDDFWPRPSAAGAIGYDATAGSGSNLGPSNPALVDAVRARVAALRAADPGNRAPVPVDLVTASASGLDPDISLAAAEYQATRISQARHVEVSEIRRIIHERTVRTLLGEPIANVLELNLALDGELTSSRVSVNATEGFTATRLSGFASGE